MDNDEVKAELGNAMFATGAVKVSVQSYHTKFTVAMGTFQNEDAADLAQILANSGRRVEGWRIGIVEGRLTLTVRLGN